MAATESTETVFRSLPVLIFRVWMHAVVVMFVWERSSSQLSRELLEHRDNANTNAPAVHTSRSVSVFAVFVIPVPWCWGTAAIRLGLNLSSRSLWVRALCCSYLPLRGLMLLALLWMNWVLAIPVFYIWKAYCILDRSFPWPRYIKGWGWTRFMCGLFWSWAHTHTHTHTHCQLLRAICVHHLTRSVLVTLDQCFSKSGPGPTSISYFKSTNYISYFGKRMLNL